MAYQAVNPVVAGNPEAWQKTVVRNLTEQIASWNGRGQDDWPASQRDFVFTPATDRPQDQPSDRATTKD
jgi:hypothetical protein